MSNIPKGYKQTEVGVIPEDWEVKRIGEIANVQGGHAFSSGKFVDSGKYQVVKMSNLYGGNLDLNRSKSFLSQLDSVEEGFLLKENDTLITLTGTVGKRDYGYAYRIRDERNLLLNQRVARIVANEKSNPVYLDFQLKTPSFLNQFFDVAKGGTGNQANVGTEDIEEIKIPLPTKAEQAAIAAALSDADALISSLEKLIAKKRNIKQGAMQELLTGKKRLPGFNEEWEVRKLGDGINLLSGHHVLAQYCNTEGNGFPYITGPADFPSGTIQHSKFTVKPTTICRTNDILVTVKGSGAGTMVLADAEYSISRQLMAVRVTDWNTSYIYYSLMHDESVFGAVATGLIPGLSRGDILNKVIPLPTKAEQTAIAQILSDMDAEIEALEQKLNKYRMIKQGMMQELLTGKTRLV